MPFTLRRATMAIWRTLRRVAHGPHPVRHWQVLPPTTPSAWLVVAAAVVEEVLAIVTEVAAEAAADVAVAAVVSASAAVVVELVAMVVVPVATAVGGSLLPWTPSQVCETLLWYTLWVLACCFHRTLRIGQAGI